MLRTHHFKVDPRRVVHETIDDETIMIDLDTGTYYSLRGSGPEVWWLLVEGWAETEVLSEMQRRYPGDAEAVATGTAALIGQLHDQGLIEPVESAEAMAHSAASTPTESQPFEPPVLERYTDMQYFLLLDPIHEVEEGGWPRASAAGAPRAAGQ